MAGGGCGDRSNNVLFSMFKSANGSLVAEEMGLLIAQAGLTTAEVVMVGFLDAIVAIGFDVSVGLKVVGAVGDFSDPLLVDLRTVLLTVGIVFMD